MIKEPERGNLKIQRERLFKPRVPRDLLLWAWKTQSRSFSAKRDKIRVILQRQVSVKYCIENPSIYLFIDQLVF